MIPDVPDSPWQRPETVAGFVSSPPNEVLMAFAAGERRVAGGTVVDIGCGAGRNAIPLGQQGWRVLGVDSSWPMLHAAAERARHELPAGGFVPVPGSMDSLPVCSRSADLVVAHGIWNLAASAAGFRAAVADAARVARPGAALFLFTFSRNTLPAAATPVAGEAFVFTQFSGAPQCFLTDAQLLAELAAFGFVPDPALPLRELNTPRPGTIPTGGPVIYEGAFRRRD
jgi:SAM-dependent methyltransferase